MKIAFITLRLLVLIGIFSLTAPLATLRASSLLNLRSAILPAPSVLGPNLVTNPGFETGDTTGYTFTPAPANSFFTVQPGASDAHSGNFSVVFASYAVGSYDTLSQTLTTVPGATYSVSFWLRNGGQPQNGFRVTFGNNTLLNFTDSASFSYTQYTYTVAASSASTVLSFAGYQVPDVIYLDDISVNLADVPEPSTWSALVLGVAGLGIVTLRRRRVARA